MRVFKAINGVGEKLEELMEGTPVLPKMMVDPTFASQIEDIVQKYSRLPFSVTPYFEGSTGEFLHFILRVFPENDTNLKLAEVAIKNAIEDFFRRNTGHLVSTVVISDAIPDGGYDIHVYFAHTRCQNRKLANWFARLTKNDYDRALREFRGLRDSALQKELNNFDD